MAGLSTRLSTVLLALSTACSGKFVAAGHNGHMLGARASVDNMRLFKGGILFIDGKQTSCDVAVIDNKTCFVSASCLKYKSKGKVDTDPKYEVYSNGGYDGSPGHYTVQTITAHPSYDPATFANNIAVLQYNSVAESTWVSYISTDSSEWADIVYGSQSIKDMEAQVWNQPILEPGAFVKPICNELYPTFGANTRDLLCSNIATKSAANTTCKVPYASAYGQISNSLFQIALYSHTAFYGDNSGNAGCIFKNYISYYTVLADYLAFANEIQHNVYYRNTSKTVAPQSDPKYEMKVPTGPTPSGVTYIGGDYYARQGGVPHSSSSSSSPSPGSSNPTNAGQNTKSSSGGLSTKHIIILAVCVSVGTVILLIGLFFLIRWIRRSRRNLAWDPDTEDATLKIMANEIGGASLPGQSDSRPGQNASEPARDAIQETQADSGLPSYTNAITQQPAPPTWPLSTGDSKTG